ncbi:hypothetical protein AgCh_033344 [Apium graveolens]
MKATAEYLIDHVYLFAVGRVQQNKSTHWHLTEVIYGTRFKYFIDIPQMLLQKPSARKTFRSERSDLAMNASPEGRQRVDPKEVGNLKCCRIRKLKKAKRAKQPEY